MLLELLTDVVGHELARVRSATDSVKIASIGSPGNCRMPAFSPGT